MLEMLWDRSISWSLQCPRRLSLSTSRDLNFGFEDYGFGLKPLHSPCVLIFSLGCFTQLMTNSKGMRCPQRLQYEGCYVKKACSMLQKHSPLKMQTLIFHCLCLRGSWSTRAQVREHSAHCHSSSLAFLLPLGQWQRMARQYCLPALMLCVSLLWHRWNFWALQVDQGSRPCFSPYLIYLHNLTSLNSEWVFVSP